MWNASIFSGSPRVRLLLLEIPLCTFISMSINCSSTYTFTTTRSVWMEMCWWQVQYIFMRLILDEWWQISFQLYNSFESIETIEWRPRFVHRSMHISKWENMNTHNSWICQESRCFIFIFCVLGACIVSYAYHFPINDLFVYGRRERRDFIGTWKAYF